MNSFVIRLHTYFSIRTTRKSIGLKKDFLFRENLRFIYGKLIRSFEKIENEKAVMITKKAGEDMLNNEQFEEKQSVAKKSIAENY